MEIPHNSEIPFDHSLIGTVGEPQPSLLYSVNGKLACRDFGLNLFNGKVGGIAVTGDGRFSYHCNENIQSYGQIVEQFQFVFDSGDIFLVELVIENYKIIDKTLWEWLPEENKWRDKSSAWQKYEAFD